MIYNSCAEGGVTAVVTVVLLLFCAGWQLAKRIRTERKSKARTGFIISSKAKDEVCGRWLITKTGKEQPLPVNIRSRLSVWPDPIKPRSDAL